MRKVSKLFTHILFYSIFNSIEALAPFLLVPILTRYLVPEEYGIWVLFISLTAFLRPIVGLTLEDSVRMRYFELNERQLSSYLVTAFTVMTGATLIALIIVWLFPQALSAATKFPADWLWSIVIAAYLYGLFYTLLAFFQFSEDRLHFGWTQILQMAITLGISSLLVVIGFSWEGAVLGKISGLFLATAIAILFFMPHFIEKRLSHFQPSYARELLWFGMRYLPSGIGIVLIPLSDRLFVVHYVGFAEASLFGIGAQFATVLLLAVHGFYFAWLPWMFNKIRLGDRESKKKIAIISILYYLLLPLAGLIISALSFLFLPYLVGSAFQESAIYINWLIIATIAQGFFMHNQGFIHYTKRVAYMSICMTVAIVTNIVLNYYLVETHGALGIAWATIAAYGSAACLSGIIAATFLRSQAVEMVETEEVK